MTNHMTDRGCPTEDVWMEFLDAAAEGDLVADRTALQRHLDGCTDCRADVDDLRKFNTVLLRARVPGLGDEQWRVLDERMEMMGSEYVPPPKIATKVYFGLAMAAALSLFAVGVYHLLYVDKAADVARRHAPAIAKVAERATAGQLTAGATEGRLEIADAQGHWGALTTGATLTKDARIRAVGVDGRLVVPGHFELRVAAGSELQLIACNERNTWLRLREGEVACTVEKRRPNQQFKVLAGGYRASVVGTEFVVSLRDADAAVQVRVNEGAVRVDEAAQADARAGESTTVVRAGNRWRFAGGRIEYGPIAATARQNAEKPAAQPASATQQAPAAAANDAKPPADQLAVEAVGRGARRSGLRRDRSTRAGVAADPAQPPVATSAQAARPGQAAPPRTKIVEIKVPAQWHREAEEAEVRRLKKLGSHSQSSRSGAKQAPPTGWTAVHDGH